MLLTISVFRQHPGKDVYMLVCINCQILRRPRQTAPTSVEMTTREPLAGWLPFGRDDMMTVRRRGDRIFRLYWTLCTHAARTATEIAPPASPHPSALGEMHAELRTRHDGTHGVNRNFVEGR